VSRLELLPELRERVFGRLHATRAHEVRIDRVALGLDGVTPDPFFRRRLRTQIVNYYVAQREGHLGPERPVRRQMGRLGRSTLYASFALAVSATAVGAAAGHSLPGGLLYPVKLRLEEIRMYVAPPSLRDDLLATALATRVDELKQLVSSGSWTLVPAAAERVTAVEATLDRLDSTAAGDVAQSEAVLGEILASAPASARAGLERALDAHPAKPPRQPFGRGQFAPGAPAGASATSHPHPAVAAERTERAH
jgi:hypothetical protein